MSIRQKWNGRWNDGKTANSHEVEVVLNDDSLRFDLKNPTSSEQTMPEFWRYDKIHSPTPIKPNSDHVLLTYEQKEGQRLFIDHPDIAKRILDFAPNITAGKHTWHLLKWPLGMAGAMVLFWALTYFNIISPAKYIATMLPDNTRVSLGQGVIKTVQRKNKVCSTPEGSRAFNKLITRLNQGLDKKQSFDIKIVDLSYENAFAAPGDQLIMSGKLIRNAKSADEVAGVLAHEMGHAVKLHPETNIVRALGILAALQLFTAGESGTFGELAFFLVQSGYSRQAETEADQFAAKVLNNSNIDTRPLAGFFERIIKQRKIKIDEGKKSAKSTKSNDKEKKSEPSATNTTDGRSLMEWISSHPATDKRIEFFNKSSITTTPEILSQSEWQALQKICGEKKEKPKDKDLIK